ncbi:MAG: flagellar motor stator protein MotA [Calditrichaeota bacterium]|nr:flagellar motor stator protein MotA [Calditrichota bacterium]
MTAIVGYILVLLFVFGGYAISGGNMILIFKPWYEYVIIGGAALGGLIVKSNTRTLKLVIEKSLDVFKGKSLTREVYMDALKLVHDLAFLARREGLLALEGHIQAPATSTIFQKYPSILHHPRLVNFITDNLKIVVVGGTSPGDLEALMDSDIETIEEEHSAPQQILTNTADALPALGIVAAVMGIIKTMASIAEGPEVVGMKVASALVGTFLGVLLSYGFVGPLAMNVEMQNLEEGRIMQLLKAGILGIMRGMNPKLSAEYARRAIYESQRPSFDELEAALKG